MSSDQRMPGDQSLGPGRAGQGSLESYLESVLCVKQTR